MNKTATKLVLTCGILALTTSFTNTSGLSPNIQQPTEATKVTNFTTDTIIKVDGSSTVYPITQAVAKIYQSNAKNNSQVNVSISGTSGGVEKFCTGKIDVSNASRPINQSEMAACKKNGSVGYVPLSAEADKLDSIHLYKGKAGTVFGGKSEFNLTLEQLLRKQKQF